MSYETIEYTVADGVATITLNRPGSMNAMNAVMRRELLQAITEASEGARALVLTGKGRGFCAGQDLGDVTSFEELDLERTLREEYDPILSAIRECPIPTIAAINGAAAGAGANIALGADIVIAARSASFLEAFARIGLIPDAGGTYLLPRLVGRARAMGLSLLADPLPAEKAAEWGLIWDVVADDALMDHVNAMARKLAAGPTKAYRLMKEALNASPENGFETQTALEAKLQGQAGSSRDFKEGVMAFLEKRKPSYEGR
ncbi:MAG: enoyl-CoA hydratase-related protein [Pseudomonadota bacterium]